MKRGRILFLIIALIVVFVSCSDENSGFAVSEETLDYPLLNTEGLRNSDLYKGIVFVNNAITSENVEMVVAFNKRLKTCNVILRNVSFSEDSPTIKKITLSGMEKQGNSYFKTADTISDIIINDIVINFYNNNVILNAMIKTQTQEQNINMSLRYEGIKQNK